jgi:hypothetical protein
MSTFFTYGIDVQPEIDFLTVGISESYMKLKIWTFIIAIILSSCSSSYDPDRFERDVWLSNNKMTDTRNPRAKMARDLLENYLKPGIHRDSILTLLGLPYLERIENRLPKGLEVPDSLSLIGSVNLESLIDSVNFKNENRDTSLQKYNEWYRKNSQPDTLMLYPVGWSTIDPNFLVIKFTGDSNAYEFWIEQH